MAERQGNLLSPTCTVQAACKSYKKPPPPRPNFTQSQPRTGAQDTREQTPNFSTHNLNPGQDKRRHEGTHPRRRHTSTDQPTQPTSHTRNQPTLPVPHCLTLACSAISKYGKHRKAVRCRFLVALCRSHSTHTPHSAHSATPQRSEIASQPFVTDLACDLVIVKRCDCEVCEVAAKLKLL